MVRVKIACPDCDGICLIPLEDLELIEDCMTEGFEFECACGCSFAFDVYLDVMNKERKQPAQNG